MSVNAGTIVAVALIPTNGGLTSPATNLFPDLNIFPGAGGFLVWASYLPPFKAVLVSSGQTHALLTSSGITQAVGRYNGNNSVTLLV